MDLQRINPGTIAATIGNTALRDALRMAWRHRDRIARGAYNGVSNYLRGPSRYQDRGSGTGSWRVSQPVNRFTGSGRVIKGRGRFSKAGRKYYRRRTRKVKKVAKRKVKNTFWEIFKKVKKNGASVLQEVGTSYNSPYCAFVGHSTQPIKMIQRTFFAALVKKLIYKRGLVASDAQETIQGVVAGDAIYVYYADRLANNVVSNFSHTFVAGGLNIGAAVDGLLTAFNAINLENIEFTIMQYYANGASDSADAFIDLRKAEVMWYCKSNMKIQNITPGDASADQEADDVDAVHLTGKQYDFKSTSLRVRNRSPGFVATDIQSTTESGAMVYSTTDANMREPPEANYWENYVKVKRINLKPGGLMKSNLEYAKKLSMTMFVKNILCFTRQDSPANNFNQKSSYCVSRVFAFEKEIETTFGAAPAINVQVNYEVNAEVGCDIQLKQVNSLLRLNYVGAYP